MESQHPDVIQRLLKDPEIQECRLRNSVDSNDGLIAQSQTKAGIQVFCLKFFELL